MLRLGYKKIVEHALPPFKATERSACFDIHACLHGETVKVDGNREQKFRTRISEKGNIIKSVIIDPGSVMLVPTGLIFIIPREYQLKIVPRSGYAWKNKITVMNSPGTIDSDYPKETFVLLHNASVCNCFRIDDGMRIAQAELMVNNSLSTELYEADDSDVESIKTDRVGGFNSTKDVIIPTS